MKEEPQQLLEERSTKERFAWGGAGAALAIPVTFLLNQYEPLQRIIAQAPPATPYAEYGGMALFFFLVGGALTANTRRRVNPVELHRTGPLR